MLNRRSFLSVLIGGVVLVAAASYAQIQNQKTPLTVYNIVDFGAINDGNPVNCAVNTAAIQKAFNAAASNPAPIYFPMGKGFAVNNGQLTLPAPNMVVYGNGSMGSVPDWAQTSTIAGYGPGHTLTVQQGGCQIRGLAWKSDGQTGTDSCIVVKETQVTLDDMFFDSPNKGISLQWPYNMPGQFWAKNILMGGNIKSMGIDINAGGGAVKLDHVRMFNGTMEADSPQPKYGVLVRAAGEFVMCGACDIDNTGIPLAILPGIDGVPNTYVQAITISDSFFDNGNGAGQIVIHPEGSSFILNANLVNVWCSSVNNGNGKWPGNGLTIDGSHSFTAAGFPSICNVSVSNSVFQNSANHVGIYANTVTGLSVVGCSAWNNFVGIQTFHCTGILAANKCGAYMPPALGFSQAGNKTYGILLEKSNLTFNPADNTLIGNGTGPFRIIP